jgi:Skp family chaperone for outer membrane proteins
MGGRVCRDKGDRTVKRKVILVAGMAALAIGLYVGARLSADPAAPATSVSQCRVAVMNMQKVANDYMKTAVLRKQIEAMNSDYDKKLQDIQKEMQKLTPLPSNPKDAETAQKTLVDLKRRGEDLTAERNKVLGEKYSEGEKAIYKDIEAAVQVFARSRSIDLVFYYNDVPDEAQKYTPQALQKRIGSSGMPIYTSQGTDVTGEVVHVLNWNYTEQQKKGGGSGQ